MTTDEIVKILDRPDVDRVTIAPDGTVIVVRRPQPVPIWVDPTLVPTINDPPEGWPTYPQVWC